VDARHMAELSALPRLRPNTVLTVTRPAGTGSAAWSPARTLNCAAALEASHLASPARITRGRMRKGEETDDRNRILRQ